MSASLSINESAPLLEVGKGPPRTIGLVQLVVLSYFITCGNLKKTFPFRSLNNN
jgi:hypothetical protein